MELVIKKQYINIHKEYLFRDNCISTKTIRLPHYRFTFTPDDTTDEFILICIHLNGNILLGGVSGEGGQKLYSFRIDSNKHSGVHSGEVTGSFELLNRLQIEFLDINGNNITGKFDDWTLILHLEEKKTNIDQQQYKTTTFMDWIKLSR